MPAISLQAAEKLLFEDRGKAIAQLQQEAKDLDAKKNERLRLCQEILNQAVEAIIQRLTPAERPAVDDPVEIERGPDGRPHQISWPDKTPALKVLPPLKDEPAPAGAM